MIHFSTYKLNSVAIGTLISYTIYFNRFGDIPSALGDLLYFSTLILAYIIPGATINCSIKYVLPSSSGFSVNE